MSKPIQIAISEILLGILFCGNIIPVSATWSDISWPSVPSAPQVEYISCPIDHTVTDDELALLIGITEEDLIAMKNARSLSNDMICNLPKSRIARALKKTKDSSQPSIDGFMKWRTSTLASDASGTINDINARVFPSYRLVFRSNLSISL